MNIHETVVRNLMSDVSSGELTLDNLKDMQAQHSQLVRVGLNTIEGGMDRTTFVGCLDEVIGSVEQKEG